MAEPLAIGETFPLDSAILGETRRINVYLPPAYSADGFPRLPVLYLIDGGLKESFVHLAGLVQVLTSNGTMRPFLLVGIENTQRGRDLTGPTQNAEHKKLVGQTGGSANFRRFLRDELMPQVKARYRTTEEAALVGQSLGGLFALEAFLLEPDLFDTYVAVDPSLWWDDQALLDGVAERLRNWHEGQKTLYLATSSEPSIAPLLPRLTDILNRNAPASIRHFTEYLPAETHGTVFHPAAWQAFRLVFKPHEP